MRGESYSSQSSLTLSFGLGQQDLAEVITIRWPSGIVDELYNIEANQIITIQEGSNQVCPELGNLNSDTSNGADGVPNTGDAGEGDDVFNVLDIVVLANCVLGNNCADLDYACAGDLNGDGVYNVLDIVVLANCVLAQNCGN